ncbi:unnamed protein product [Rotaria socialis]|uniref:Uncharacterized protein n=3 Tax=Rotaria socialis TaxID=392032 RepID=A0A818FC26_9BILA|nr:unnamed protein product [Rotaria socialis]CAF4482531.1 unnamed protein product [Rotaria socialis]
MYGNVGLFHGVHDHNYYDITHSFKVDSFTYHVLGLRKDRPSYASTYYIFNCPDCTEERPNIVPLSKKSSHFDRISAMQQASKSKGAINRARPSSVTPRKVERETISIEQSIAQMMKTERQSLVKSLRKTIKAENETLLQSIKESSKKTEETTVVDEKISTLLETEHQTMVESFRRELKAENELLIQSIKVEEQHLVQESTKSMVTKDELVRLFEEQKQSIESIYERQIRTIDSSVDRISETVTQLVNNKQESLPALNQFQLTMIQTIEKEVQRTLSKTIEKFESMTLSITQLKHTIEQRTENKATIITRDETDALNRLFVEQKNFLIDTIEQQQTLWSEHLQRILRQIFIEQTWSSLVAKSESTVATDIKNTAQTTINMNIQQLESISQNVAVESQHSLPNKKAADGSFGINQDSFNSPDRHLLKVSIKTPEPVHVFAKFYIAGIEYPEKSHTLCQPDPMHSDQVTCYVAPPTVDGPYNVIIYAKTNTETEYRAAMSLRLPGPNISQTILFPYTFPSFELQRCTLIQPLQSFLRHNTMAFIHMVIPDAREVKIQNGNNVILLNENEYSQGILRKQIEVRGDVYVYGQWKNKTDSPICFFYVI